MYVHIGMCIRIYSGGAGGGLITTATTTEDSETHATAKCTPPRRRLVRCAWKGSVAVCAREPSAALSMTALAVTTGVSAGERKTRRTARILVRAKRASTRPVACI